MFCHPGSFSTTWAIECLCAFDSCFQSRRRHHVARVSVGINTIFFAPTPRTNNRILPSRTGNFHRRGGKSGTTKSDEKKPTVVQSMHKSDGMFSWILPFVAFTMPGTRHSTPPAPS